MLIKDLETQKQYFKENVKTPIFGAGVYAFNRLGMEHVIDNYQILALRNSLDTDLIKDNLEVLSLEEGMGTKHIKEPRNSTTVVTHPRTEKYLKDFKDPAIIVYKPSTKMEKYCQEKGWNLMSNPTAFGKKMFENKINFRRILEELNVAVPLGRIAKVEELSYGHLLNKYGIPFVIQHPTKGGGKGTFFINNQEEFDKAIHKLTKKREKIFDWDEDEEKDSPTNEVIVSKFIQGPSPSLTCCATRFGIISTNLQHQVLDIPELFSSEKGSGLFCGHDWSSANFSDQTSQQAYEVVEKVGQYFKKEGYKGIFGLDFIMDQKTGKLYVTECNPRLVGSFPTILMTQALNKEPSIMGFHVLEFLNADYELDVESVNRLMRQKKKGSQMFLHNLTGHWARNHYELKAGIYKLKKGKLQYLRAGYDLAHLKDTEEFLIADGVLMKNSHFSPNRRLGRILTLNRSLDDTYRALNPWAKEVVETLYKDFKMKRIRFIRFKKIFFPNLLAKG